MRRLGAGLVFGICGMVACGDDAAPIDSAPLAPTDGADAGSSSSSSGGSTSSGGSSSGGMGGDAGAVNVAPSAANGAMTVEIGDAVTGALTGSDANGDALSFAIVTPPTKGTVTNLNAATGAFTYTSTTFAPGTDSFTFKTSDGKLDSAPATMNVSLDSVLFTGHYALANVKDNATTSCSTSKFRLAHARAASGPGYIVVSPRQIVCGSTTWNFDGVRLPLGANAATTDTVMTFSQSKYVSGCGTVTDDFRLEKNANGSFAFKETAYAPCFGIGTHVLTADATRTPVAYLLAEPNAPVAFGHAFSGDVVTPRSVSLRNVGRLAASPLALTSVTKPFSFVAGGTCGAQLAGLSSCSFSIGMASDTVGDFSSAWAAEYMDGVDAEVEAASISGTVVPKLPNPTAITAGTDFTCAIASGKVVCWGANTDGQTTVPTLSNPKSISAGSNHVCAIDDGGVKCWGSNTSGQTTVPALSNPKQVSAGYDHTCALDDTGVVCWGGNGFKQSTVPPLTSPTSVSAGTWLTCAMHATGVTCWGTSNGTTVPALSSPTEVVAASSHACAIDSTGVVCWGASAYGATSPPALTSPSHVDGAGYRGCAIASGTVSCWGIDALATPTVTQATALAVGDNHVCAIANGAVRCWAGQTYP